jgi:hypothetical protein
MTIKEKYKHASVGDRFKVSSDRIYSERQAANKVGWTIATTQVEDGHIVEITGKIEKERTILADMFRDAVIGDEFIVPPDKARTVRVRLNQNGWSVKSNNLADGNVLVRIVNERDSDKRAIISMLSRLSLRKLEAIVAACKQAKLIA